VRKGFFLLLSGVVAVAAIAAGCGNSGGGGSGVTESSISKPEYITKAEIVCTNGNKQIEIDYGAFLGETDEENPGNGEDKVDFNKFVDNVITPNVEREIEELRELGAPKGDAGKVEAMLKAREESIAIAEKDPEAVIQDSKKVFGKASAAAEEYGLKLCATR
jgi:hypothetical protein